MYIDKSIKDYLYLLQKGDPTPGGGSAASLVSNLGVALTLMTSNFSLEKKYFKELDPKAQEEMKEAHSDIEESINKFSKFMDEDAKGFASVIEVYEDDSFESEEEKKKALQESYKKALSTPLNCARECLKLLKLQTSIVKYGNKQTISDVGVGVVLAYAALEGSLMSVRINLNYIEDKNYINEIQSEINKLSKEASNINNNLRDKINKILEESL